MAVGAEKNKGDKGIGRVSVGFAILNWSEKSVEKLTFETRPEGEEGMSLVTIWGKGFLGRRNSLRWNVPVRCVEPGKANVAADE